MQHKHKVRLARVATLGAATAGILYNSWPLGFWLNPKVSLAGGFASELEALHQPYNWLFIGLDVATGVLVMVVAGLLWQSRMRRLGKLALLSFALFGVFTIVDALLPMQCAPSLAACAQIDTDPMLLLHGIANVGGAVTLFISAALVWQLRRARGGGMLMRVLMGLWVGLGLISLYFFFIPGPGYLSQDYFLLLTGLWVAAMPGMILRDDPRRRA